jgi:hypothetical protein
MFDRMVAARENGRRMLRKEAERLAGVRGTIPTNPPSRRSVSMATEKQIAANRANAQKVRGPRRRLDD